jgi:hypothetical protein
VADKRELGRRMCMVRSSSASNYRRVLNAGVLLPSAIQHVWADVGLAKAA